MGTLGQNVLRGNILSLHNVPTGTSVADLVLALTPRWKVPAGTFQPLNVDAGPNVPVGTLDAFCTQIHVVHNSSTLHSKCESNYSANSSGLIDNLWDASSLLPIRRAAWVRLRLPST